MLRYSSTCIFKLRSAGATLPHAAYTISSVRKVQAIEWFRIDRIYPDRRQTMLLFFSLKFQIFFILLWHASAEHL